ncbi:protein phosphatase Slingshot homolog 2 isoform X2 [Thalassophryne amazonica]|uniref:protein phosphatase Slingshot homolog 2 isoform X2 n=1 Tax=Thalassophryne amazonica TaxID=390379 RepID=UPI001470C463|nr:protein phosphatase Slingshot homolog 2 isoform X2 [Thalassophryne amazonica]
MALVTVQRSPTPSTTSSPSVSESGSCEDERRSQARSISESFLTVKGAALFLPRGNSPTPNAAPRISQRRNKHTGDLQKHLQTMFTVLRPEDTIRLAVRLESSYPQVTRYMVVVSTSGRQDTEESIVLGMDFLSSDSCCTVGLVLPLWSDTLIHLDGDGGFSVSTVNRVHIFKPVSVQAMWSALQSLHKACEMARCHNYYPGSLFLTWVSYYQSRISSNQYCINEWNAMQDVESYRANSPVFFTDLPTERERTERLIRMRLREIIMQKDLENVTCKEIRTELEIQMGCNLREFKEFIDNEMIIILGQMDSPTEIFQHVYLGSEWNASNLEELQNSGVRYILNVTREIDNFFPGMFEYHNIRVYDEEATNLLEYWNDTYKFITKAKKAGAKCLVHCKMGVSRSASTVIAYAMKEYGWDLDTAFDYVKERRTITKPNPSFMKQLEEYQGILLASKQRHNKLWRSRSDGNLSDHPEIICKPSSHSLSHCDSHINNTASSAALHHFLGVAVLHALGADSQDSGRTASSHSSDPHMCSNGVCESPATEEVDSDCEQCEDADSSANVAVAVPTLVPHPPASLHILPPTPERQSAEIAPPTKMSSSLPKHDLVKLPLPLSERSSSDELSSLTVGSSDLDNLESDLISDTYSPFSPENTKPLTLVLSSSPSDDNNNPSEPQTNVALDSRGEADGSSNHSTDSIDFFSAREKFLGLAQDDRAWTLSDEVQQRTLLSPVPLENEETKKEKEDLQGDGMAQTPPHAEDNTSETDPERPNNHDGGKSVRHIVTELEAICQPASCLLSPAAASSSAHLVSSQSSQEETETSVVTHESLTLPSQSPTTLPSDRRSGSVRRATQQLEEKLRQETEMAASQRSPLHSPTSEHPPAQMSPCHLNSGSPSPDSSLHSAGQTPSSGPQTFQGKNDSVSINADPKDGEEETMLKQELQSPASPTTDNFQHTLCFSDIGQGSGAAPNVVPTSVDNHTATEAQASSGLVATTSQSEGSLLLTSAPSQRQSPLNHQNPQVTSPSQASSNHITLQGVTMQESDTDPGPGSGVQSRRVGCGPGCDALNRLSHGSQELERIQQTLRELQAFLQEGVGLKTPDNSHDPETPRVQRETMDTQPAPCKETICERVHLGLEAGPRPRERPGKKCLEPKGWHGAAELEARIRQAGLTPPSLMKRSASLAKLDCLELSASDLSDWDIRTGTHRTSSSEHQNTLHMSPSPSDDAWKKQRVFPQTSYVEKLHDAKDADGASSHPSPLSSSSTCHQRDRIDEAEKPGDGGNGALAAPTARQQGRGHTSRRPRKASADKRQRAITVLYNTM